MELGLRNEFNCLVGTNGWFIQSDHFPSKTSKVSGFFVFRGNFAEMLQMLRPITDRL
jgi:hypothetical protein